MRFYNEVVPALSPGSPGFTIMIDRIGEEPDTIDLADDWCRGYIAGFDLREAE
jgi:hypothetical protein